MQKQSAMSCGSPLGDYKLEQLSDSELEDLLLFKYETNKEVNDPSLKLTRCETAEKVLHDIEDLVKEEKENWLEEFPLFEEIQSLISLEEIAPQIEQKSKDSGAKSSQGQAAPNENPCATDVGNHPSGVPELFPSSYEHSTTFVVSHENILFVDAQPFFHVAPLLQPECWNGPEPPEESDDDKSPGPDPADDVSDEMAVVDEILKTTVLELDQWESDASSSSLASESSPKRTEEETSDPEWSPGPSKPFGESRKHLGRRTKPYWRGGSQEDKKLRKKEQNKNAATRYRQKKKAEVSEILKEEEELIEKKRKLEDKVSDIQNEIKCLKGLMRDLFRARGLIN